MSFTNLNELFHIFSKSPVRSGQILGSARNKSGHTITASDVWAEDIPAMFYAYTTQQKDNFANIATPNDLCYDKTVNKLYYYKNNSWVERPSLSDQEILFNSSAAIVGIYNDGTSYNTNEKLGVIKYHKDKPANAITGDNNNQSSGNGYTARIKKSDDTFISQFVSSMDKIVQGNPSSLYDVVVVSNEQTLEESAEDSTEKKYISNSYAGIIQFHSTLNVNDSGDFNNVKVSVFEYIGKKLNDSLSNIAGISNHDISHKYDKTNNVKSFKDGIITFSDGTTDEVDVQKAVIAKYLFRGDSSSTITEFNTRKEYDTWLNNRAHCNDFYYEYDAFDYDDIYDDDLNSSGKEILSTLQNVINGKSLFLRSQLTKFNDDLSCLMNGFQMFASSNKLESFRSALPSLTNGIKMFANCSALTKFETKLPNLVLAECMFRYATSLKEINTCLPNLTQAQGMFMYCSNLSKVRFSKNSFQCLYNGCDMFKGCSSLTSFHYELPYLETADDMFLGCKLDLETVKIIAESLYDFGTKDSNDYAEDGRKHVITFGVTNDVSALAQGYKTLMESKGWVVEGLDYKVSYDISEENGYCPDASAWPTEICDKYDLEVTSIPYNEDENVGEMLGREGI